MGQLQLELIHDAKAALGEGPCWDHRSGTLYWVDIAGKRVHVFNPQTKENRIIQLEQMVGVAVPRESGGMIAGLENGIYVLDLETEQLTLVEDPESGLENNRFNDGKCDAAGRFWAGTMSTKGQKEAGSLYCLEPGGTIRKVVEGVTTSNGIGWSPDGRTMYYIDTPTKLVVAYPYDEETGRLGDVRTAVSIPAGEGSPDGMTVDAEGMLWVAHWGGWQVSRWNPHTGEKLTAVPVPAAQVTSCAFGGPSLDELYITTARIGQSEEALLKQPHAGGVFRYKPGITGMPVHFYKG
ncbi:MAG: putative Membrane Associated Protein [Paenibacillus sp.]|jgi:sugar lactone lactonase YvrE|nr:putative Membrane Associated Protein [Paenibacillus sp.]